MNGDLIVYSIPGAEGASGILWQQLRGTWASEGKSKEKRDLVTDNGQRDCRLLKLRNSPIIQSP